MELQEIQIKPLEDKIILITSLLDKCRLSRDKNIINELEFEFFEYSNMVADIKRVFSRNWYVLQKEKDGQFLKERENSSSDLTTTKKVNKIYINENTMIELQEMIIDFFEKKQDTIKRLCNHINSMFISDLSDRKNDLINK